METIYDKQIGGGGRIERETNHHDDLSIHSKDVLFFFLLLLLLHFVTKTEQTASQNTRLILLVAYSLITPKQMNVQ